MRPQISQHSSRPEYPGILPTFRSYSTHTYVCIRSARRTSGERMIGLCWSRQHQERGLQRPRAAERRRLYRREPADPPDRVAEQHVTQYRPAVPPVLPSSPAAPFPFPLHPDQYSIRAALALPRVYDLVDRGQTTQDGDGCCVVCGFYPSK